MQGFTKKPKPSWEPKALGVVKSPKQTGASDPNLGKQKLAEPHYVPNQACRGRHASDSQAALYFPCLTTGFLQLLDVSSMSTKNGDSDKHQMLLRILECVFLCRWCCCLCVLDVQQSLNVTCKQTNPTINKYISADTWVYLLLCSYQNFIYICNYKYTIYSVYIYACRYVHAHS